MAEPQSFKNHTRFHPPFHFFTAPLLLVNLIYAVYSLIHHFPEHVYLRSWWVVMSIALFVIAGLTRTYALKVQDRVIRLEERLRLASLLPAAAVGEMDSLSAGQFVALRFASDAELPALARRAVAENLDPKQIKQAVTTWRPDHHRV